jgi:hypothetical protein
MVRKLPAHLLSILLLAGGGTAHAQSDAEDRTLERAGKIASQPARDVGISSEKIAPVLQAAVEGTYREPGNGRCNAVARELGQLNDALGPDFDGPQRGDDKVTQLAEAGGEMVVNSLIPFRGIVREVSGAAAKDRRKRAAINAGIARRGYLRGLAAAKGCKLPVAKAGR